MYCRNCGAEVEPGKFCPQCGKKVEENEQIQQREQQVSVEYQTTPASYEYVYPTVSGIIEPVKISTWMFTIFIMMIPLVNFVYLIYCACDSSRPSRANYMRAQLIILLLVVLLSILIVVLTMLALGNL